MASPLTRSKKDMKLNHLAIPYVAVLIFLIGSVLGTFGVTWYETLELPTWSPTTALIALIWAVIYAGVAYSLLVIWNKTLHDEGFRWLMRGFAVAAVVNLVWAVAFFIFHDLTISFWSAVVLSISMCVITADVALRSRKAGLLLAPYTAWVLFATYFMYVVMQLNV